MVIQGDFKVELVEATTKEPFREHRYNGETYVEVEPGAEYYLSRQRVGNRTHSMPLLLLPFVDGKRVGWQGMNNGGVDPEPIYGGVWRKSKNECGDMETEEVSLRFANASIGDHGGHNSLMGKVEFQLYEDSGPGGSLLKESSEFARSSRKNCCVPFSVAAKAVRSTQGSSMKRIAAKPGNYRGAHLETITLHYCTAPGLIKVGILPKPPDIYSMHRLVTGKKPAALPPLLVQPQKTFRKTKIPDGQAVSTQVTMYDLFDLSVLDDSDDDSEDEEKGSCSPSSPTTTPNHVGEQRAHKKPRV